MGVPLRLLSYLKGLVTEANPPVPQMLPDALQQVLRDSVLTGMI